jgi:flagellar basal-body rod modification protein FlgD
MSARWSGSRSGQPQASSSASFDSLVASLKGSAGTSTRTSGSASANEGEDRFLKLLVAQMNNQDPLSPMDNAQVTSQLAQIPGYSVSG